MPQHQDGQHNRARHQKHGLYDLHPGGRQHAAEHDVDHHQGSHPDHRHAVTNPGVLKQKRDQGAGADHLHDHVEGADDQRADGSHGGNGSDTVTVSQHVSHRVLADVAQRFGNDQQYSHEGDEAAPGKHKAVNSKQRDQAHDPEK